MLVGHASAAGDERLWHVPGLLDAPAARLYLIPVGAQRAVPVQSLFLCSLALGSWRLVLGSLAKYTSFPQQAFSAPEPQERPERNAKVG
jgi:hypothetical protein